MKILTNAWFWFAVFCVGLFFAVQAGLSSLNGWVAASTPPEPDYTQSTLTVEANAQEQISSPTHFVQGSGNVIQPSIVDGMEFAGVR
jgi:hypothetical protein